VGKVITITINTTVHMPEIPDQLKMEQGSLNDALTKLLTPLPIKDEIMDKATGEVKLEGLFEVLLNDTPHNSLRNGLKTELHDGDTITLSLILLGGG
jgi:hypothetical protein